MKRQEGIANCKYQIENLKMNEVFSKIFSLNFAILIFDGFAKSRQSGGNRSPGKL
jgi:hypothetical protein